MLKCIIKKILTDIDSFLFLWQEFVPPVDWMHLDIAGVMGPNYENAYLGKGMTGRPTRTLIEFLKSRS